MASGLKRELGFCSDCLAWFLVRCVVVLGDKCIKNHEISDMLKRNACCRLKVRMV